MTLTMEQPEGDVMLSLEGSVGGEKDVDGTGSSEKTKSLFLDEFKEDSSKSKPDSQGAQSKSKSPKRKQKRKEKEKEKVKEKAKEQEKEKQLKVMQSRSRSQSDLLPNMDRCSITVTSDDPDSPPCCRTDLLIDLGDDGVCVQSNDTGIDTNNAPVKKAVKPESKSESESESDKNLKDNASKDSAAAAAADHDKNNDNKKTILAALADNTDTHASPDMLDGNDNNTNAMSKQISTGQIILTTDLSTPTRKLNITDSHTSYRRIIEKEITDLKLQLAEAHTLLDTLQHKLNRTTRDRDLLQKQVHLVSDTCHSMQKKSDEITTVIQHLQENAKESAFERASLRDRLDRCTLERNKFEISLKECESKYKSIRSENRMHIRFIEEMENEAEGRRMEIQGLRSENDWLKQKLAAHGCNSDSNHNTDDTHNININNNNNNNKLKKHIAKRRPSDSNLSLDSQDYSPSMDDSRQFDNPITTTTTRVRDLFFQKKFKSPSMDLRPGFIRQSSKSSKSSNDDSYESFQDNYSFQSVLHIQREAEEEDDDDDFLHDNFHNSKANRNRTRTAAAERMRIRRSIGTNSFNWLGKLRKHELSDKKMQQIKHANNTDFEYQDKHNMTKFEPDATMCTPNQDSNDHISQLSTSRTYSKWNWFGLVSGSGSYKSNQPSSTQNKIDVNENSTKTFVAMNKIDEEIDDSNSVVEINKPNQNDTDNHFQNQISSIETNNDELVLPSGGNISGDNNRRPDGMGKVLLPRSLVNSNAVC